MNTKGITAVKDQSICMKCLKKRATHTYKLCGRGYGSAFDLWDTKFQCCDDCDKPEYEVWFSEKAFFEEDDDTWENYEHEEEISDMINALPLEAIELFANTFEHGYGARPIDPQDWIDYNLGELPPEKKEELHLK